MLIKAAASGLDMVVRPKAGVVILAYHRVGGGTELELDLEPTVFAEQMAWLAGGERAASIDDGLDQLRAGRDQRSVVVTFDDGTADFVDHALPALKRHRLRSTMYFDASTIGALYIAIDTIF